MIKVENLKKKFVTYKNKREKQEFYANNGISFEAVNGEIVGILRTKRGWKNNAFKDDCWNFRTN